MENSKVSSNHCQVCGNFARGFHFGVKSCRACAAFFRRALLAPKQRKSCKLKGNCQIFNGEKYICKSCRLKKCREVGMDGDSLITSLSSSKVSIPKSVEKFVGRPSLVLFCTKKTPMKRTFVNVKNLVNGGWDILKNHSATPLVTKSQLQKLTLGSQKFLNFSKFKFSSKLTKKDTMEMWEFDLLSTATWLTHFDEFRTLPISVQMKILQSTWHIWARFYSFTQTVKLRNTLKSTDDGIMCSGRIYVDIRNSQFDISWLSSYPAEQLMAFLVLNDGKFEVDHFVHLINKLEPTDVEITFMFANLCFEYAASRFPGELRDISERFQQILANDLHNHYYETCTRTPKVVNYAGRMAQMMKINREIQKSIRRFREKTKIARTFDVFTADYSHPEMFTDFGC